MIARVLDIPDDDAGLAAWLDGQIAGPNLHELVAELAAVHGADRRQAAGPDEVAAWLGSARSDVLARGTAALDRRRLGDLLRAPHLLPGLQELAFVEGSAHWDEVAGRSAPAPAFSAADVLRRGGTRSAPRDAAAPPNATPRARRPQRVPRLIAGLAASVLVALGAWSLLRPAAPWGWNRPDAFVAAAPDAYLEHLAAAAGEWSAVTPASEAALAARLRELLAGCDRLITAPHEPLAAADREWLVERCRAWREKIAGHVAALGESHDVAAVRREADATVAKLVAALRSRAGEIRSRVARRRARGSRIPAMP